jgi:hypothetical protein
MPGASPTAYDAQGDGTNPNSMGDLVRGGQLRTILATTSALSPISLAIADVVTA